ncbi:hypothetical protein IGI39_001951 [Enterococcus sp. AZ135]
MKITIEGTPQEIAELLQAITSSKEQTEINIVAEKLNKLTTRQQRINY